MTAPRPTPEEAAATDIRVNVEHIARGCRSGHSHNPAVYEQAITAALDSLVAALRDARREAEAWLTPFDGSGVAWHEGLPSPYTYQASDFSALLAAVHEYECAAVDARREASEWEARAAQRWREVQAACARAEQAFRERDQARDALADLVAWADEQEAMSGVDALASLLLRLERARAALGGAAEERT